MSPERSAPVHCRDHERHDDGEHDASDDRDVPSEKDLHPDEDENEDAEVSQSSILHRYLAVGGGKPNGASQMTTTSGPPSP